MFPTFDTPDRLCYALYELEDLPWDTKSPSPLKGQLAVWCWSHCYEENGKSKTRGSSAETLGLFFIATQKGQRRVTYSNTPYKKRVAYKQ